MNSKLSVGAGPHIKSNKKTHDLMFDFIIALTPIIVLAIINFKNDFIILLAFSLAVGVSVDFIISKILELKNGLWDFSTLITTLLLVLSLPIHTPLWVVFFGVSFSIVIGKLIFGGLGQNLFNPALIGRVFLMLSFPQYLFQHNGINISSMTATLPFINNNGANQLIEDMDVGYKYFFGLNLDGSIGEISILAILFGFLYLSFRQLIDFRLPLITFGTIFFGSLILNQPVISYVFSGSILFGLTFFLTDPVTSPYTKNGKKAYGFFVALMILFIRELTSHPEGIVYAILLGNCAVPLLNNLFLPKVFGRSYEMKDLFKLIKILVLSIAILTILSFVDKIFTEKIEKKKETLLIENMQVLLPDAVNFDIYEKSKYYENYLFIPAFDGKGNRIGFIVKGVSYGFSGKEIIFLLGIDNKGITTGHRIISHQETLGLGSKLAESSFAKLWVGKDVNSKFQKGIDSPTGATYTFLNFHKTIKEVLMIFNKNFLVATPIINKSESKVRIPKVSKETISTSESAINPIINADTTSVPNDISEPNTLNNETVPVPVSTGQ